MHISTASWHYRFTRWFKGQNAHLPRTLCGYVFDLAFSFLLIGIATCVAVGLCVMIVILWREMLILVGVIGAAVGLVWLVVKFFSWAFGPSRYREPGLLVAWLIAKKRRMCPLLTYVTPKEPPPMEHTIGTLHVMDGTGDTKLIWDSRQTDEVANAKRTFDDLRKKGFLAYAVQNEGAKGEQIHSFDARAEKIILAPPMRGG